MLRSLVLNVVLAAAALAPGPVGAQEAAKPTGTLGDLVTIDAANLVLTIRTSTGATQKAVLSKSTEFLLVEPGKKTLEGAEKVSLADLKVGDRVWARGATNPDGSVTTRQVLVMNAEAIAERNRRDAEDWQKRGVIGEVKSIDGASRTLLIESYRGESLTVAVSDATVIRRMHHGSSDLASAENIDVSGIAPGNQIATRGDRDAAAGRLDAESILIGTFPRPIRGRVMAVDAAASMLTVGTREGMMTLSAGTEALFRRFDIVPAAAQPAQPAPAAQPTANGGSRRGPGGFAFALGDRAELDRRTKPIQLKDVAVGDFCFVVVEPGASATAASVKVFVKFALPRAAQPGPSGPTWPSDFGGGDLPF